jgi:hypothetical protein
MLKKSKQQWRKPKQERGIVLALTCLAGTCLIGMAAFAVDISHFYLVGSELQNAADAASLAGSAELDGYPVGVSNAVDRALSVINKAEFSGETVKFTRDGVRFAVNLSEFDNGGQGRSEADAKMSAANIRFLRVMNAPHQVSTTFASFFLNANSVSLTRMAIAGQTVSGVGNDIGLNRICNFVPLAVIQDDVTGTPLNVDSNCPDKTQFMEGCTYVIKGGSRNSTSAGNYQILAADSNNGAADAREKLAIGCSTCYQPGSYIGTEPGEKTGPAMAGLNTRFGIYTQGLDPNLYAPDKNVKEGITYAEYKSGLSQYVTAGGAGSLPNRRIIILPIINASEFAGGRTQVRITKFAPFFLRTRVGGNNDIVAEYVNRPVVMGAGYYSSADSVAGFSGGAMMSSVALYK